MDAASTLRRVRLSVRLSLRALAERANTSHATLAAYEAGRTIPRVESSSRSWSLPLSFPLATVPSSLSPGSRPVLAHEP